MSVFKNKTYNNLSLNKIPEKVGDGLLYINGKPLLISENGTSWKFNTNFPSTSLLPIGSDPTPSTLLPTPVLPSTPVPPTPSTVVPPTPSTVVPPTSGDLSKVYDPSVSSGMKSLIVQAVMSDMPSRTLAKSSMTLGGTLYAFTKKVVNSEYSMLCNGQKYFCVGKSDSNSTYLNELGETKDVSWGSFFTLMISLDSEPLSIDKLVYVDKYENKFDVECPVSLQDLSLSQGELIKLIPDITPDLSSVSGWIQLKKSNIVTPRVVVNTNRVNSTIQNAYPTNQLQPVVTNGPKVDIAYDVSLENFAYHTLLYMTVSTDEMYIPEIGDVLIATDNNGTVRGISSTIAFNTLRKHVFNIRVYTNVTNDAYENINFKLYKHNDALRSGETLLQGQYVYDLGNVLLNGTPIYAEPSISYSLNNPLIFYLGLIDKEVTSPYDWLSVNVDSNDMSFMNVFSTFTDKIQAIRNKESIVLKAGNNWIQSNQSKPLIDLDPKEFYIVKSSTEASTYSWRFEGKPIREQIGQENYTKIPLVDGYNWIGYTLNKNIMASAFINTYVKDVEDNVSEILSQNGILIKAPNLEGSTWFGDLEEFKQNDGYIIRCEGLGANNSIDLQYRRDNLTYIKMKEDAIANIFDVTYFDTLPFAVKNMKLDIINKQSALLVITLPNDVEYGAQFDVPTTFEESNLTLNKDIDFSTLVPTEVEANLVFPMNTKTVARTGPNMLIDANVPLSITKVKMLMTYTLTMENGEHNLSVNGTLDFFGKVGSNNVFTGVQNYSTWFSQVLQYNAPYKFIGVKLSEELTLPTQIDTPTPTPTPTNIVMNVPSPPPDTSNLSFVVEERGQLIVDEQRKHSGVVHVFLNTTDLNQGVRGFQFELSNIELVQPFVFGSSINQVYTINAGLIQGTSNSVVVGYQDPFTTLTTTTEKVLLVSLSYTKMTALDDNGVLTYDDVNLSNVVLTNENIAVSGYNQITHTNTLSVSNTNTGYKVLYLQGNCKIVANDADGTLSFYKDDTLISSFNADLSLPRKDIVRKVNRETYDLTTNWKIIYPTLITDTIVDLVFMFKGNEVNVIIPGLESPEQGVIPQLQFGDFWAINGGDAINLWYREDTSDDWTSQLQLASHNSGLRKLDHN